MADVYNLQNDSIDYPDIEEVLERSRWDWLDSQDVHDIFTFHVNPTVSLDPMNELEEGLFMYSTLTDLDTHEWEPFDDGNIIHNKMTMEEDHPMRYTVVHLSLDPIDEGIRSTYERRVYRPRLEYREYVLAHYRILNIANSEDSEYESGVDTDDSDDSSDDGAGFEGGHQEENFNEELDNVGEEADHGEAPPPPLCNGHCERLFQDFKTQVLYKANEDVLVAVPTAIGMTMMDANQVAELRRFVEQLKSNPSILHDPSLIFFREYLRSLGAQVPIIEKTERDYEDKAETKPSFFTNYDDDVMESDVELDNSDVVEPDNDPPQPMGDPTAEVTDENRDAAQSEKSKAMDAISDGKFDEAIEHLTKAILLNPTSGILYASRASAFLKVKKPNAAIRDAHEALQVNPDSAKGYKSQGMARAMLGQWEEAAADLHLASKLDYDEEIGAMLKKVEPNAKRIEEHRRKYQRLRKVKELQRAERERRQQQEAQFRPTHTHD